MAFSKLILIGAVGLALHATATAQIYESEGAGGVPEFSDIPTAGAEVVDLPATNLAEPPPEGEASPAPAKPATGVAETSAGRPTPGEGESGGVYYADEEDELRARRRIEEGRIERPLLDNPEAREKAKEGGAAGEHAGGRAVQHKGHGHR